jgi:glycosyltransferase involved in cell wall biosynthesis
MRLIFVTDTLSSGGSERVISILANHFVNKYETIIVCLRKQEVFYSIAPSVRILFADNENSNWLKKIVWLRRLVKRDDVVVPFMVKVYCVVLLALLGRKVNVIASERNDPKTTGKQWKFLRSLLIRNVSKIVVQTEDIKRYFSQAIQKRIHIIYNPLELGQCSTTPWDKESKTVLAIGRTDQQKNYPMMIRAFQRFHCKHQDFKLDIWGSRYPQKDINLHAIIKELNAEDYITIHGRADCVSQLYAQAYMFAMSSDYEGMSNSLIEALCSGLPVISTRVSGAVDLIEDGKNGVLIDVGDEDALVNAFTTLVENPEKARMMAYNARKLHSLFNVDKICQQWDGVILQTMSI